MTPVYCAKAPLAARSFLYLAVRSYATTSATATAPLGFLVPRWTITDAAARTGTGLRPRTRGHGVNSLGSQLPRNTSRRNLSTTAVRRATVCVRNPQQDEDGKDMMLDITPRAAKRLSEIMSKDANPDLALRIQVESGGCHGFQYLMSLVTLPKADTADSSTSIVREDDSIFQYKPDEEGTTLHHDARIILDEPSLDLLKGSKVDFTMELIGSQFKITDNPAASSSCGCGTSFDVKI